MENNVIKPETFKEYRPRKKYKYTNEDISAKIDRETKLAKHYLWMFCLKNALWLVPLIVVVLVAFIVDIYIVLGVWKNPTILFNQVRGVLWFVLAYVAGLYTDEFRRNFTKH